MTDRQAQTCLRVENACQQRLLANLVDSNQDLIDSYLERLFPPPPPPPQVQPPDQEQGAPAVGSVSDPTKQLPDGSQQVSAIEKKTS